ncbi:hypothetical protein IAT40_007664 [Kwoniella sp. CBS 6097]
MASAEDVGMLGSANGQELLENLIKEGLTPSGQDTDPSRYRKLVQVLFENCILKPIARGLPRNSQQTQYTLTILQRQTSLHPGLLYDLIDGAPFYQWLLPKLIHAAVNAEDENLYNDIAESTTAVLQAIGRDVQEDESGWAKGPRRSKAVLGHLAAACQVIFCETGTTSDASTLIFILSILAKSRAPYTDAVSAYSYSMLSQAARFAHTPTIQIRYIRIVSEAVDRLQCIALTDACKYISNLPRLLEKEWEPAMVSFFDALRKGNDSIRHEVWWSLYGQSKHLEARTPADFAKVCYLLTPIAPQLGRDTINAYIDQDLRDKWRNQVLQDPEQSAVLKRLLQQESSVSSRKRKRSEEGMTASVIVREVFPEFRRVNDVVPGLLALEPSVDQTSGDPREGYGKFEELRKISTTHGWAVKLRAKLCAPHYNTSYHSLAQVVARFEALHTPRPISILLANNLVSSPDMVGETMDFLNMTRQNFLETTLPHTLPALVLTQNHQALGLIASIVKQRLGVLIMDQIAPILARVFLDGSRTDASLNFLVAKIQSMTNANAKAPPVISATSLMTACIVDLLVMLIVELGDDDKAQRQAARNALEKAQSRQGNREDLGAYLKPHMLGVISQLNDMLHDILGKKTVDSKRKIIRSLGRLIKLVGDSMASFSPQSTLGIKELREETLKTWSLFITTLRFADVGPFVGRTTGALVAGWHAFDTKERAIAAQIINDIAENAKHLSQFVDEIVGMDGIPELAAAAATLTSQRKRSNIRDYILKILDRADSKNIAIATASFRELRLLLLSRQTAIEAMVRGDTFDPIMARVMSSLLSATTRDGDTQELRDIGYECMGIVGALDPDRLGLRADAGTMTLEHNFTEQEESVNFAVHLIRDLLVDAFRATNDTKHQTHLAYAIQELLKYCGFTPRVVLSTDKNSKTRLKWQSLPKDQLETLTPLLESRFSISDSTIKSYPHPIYTDAPTYREWLQRWTTDLIGKVMSMSGDDRGIRDSKTIFGAFRGVLRNQDVTVAHHILPHLVLNVLLSGMPTYRDEICLEINVVLQDQVNPTGSPDKRTLSAQVIFELMDHLSKWLMLFRANRTDRGSHSKIVESVLSGVETELMANAALQSRAYARSLRSFEQRVVQLRHDHRDNSDLQAYFERLHQIYAELDEPDGMEGVSAFVISPSLEHQIREHESTGRWTSAQSCWEVRLQQSPDDVNLHVGLLKCLRNLGHYGEFGRSRFWLIMSDTLRTHIRGVLSRHPKWSSELASFEAEAAWIIGDWNTVKDIGSSGPPISQALLALYEHRDLEPVLLKTRRALGLGITARQYGSVYEPLLQLHLLREIEMIHSAKRSIEATPMGTNRNALVRNTTQSLTASLDSRFAFTSPAFRIREAILSIRRTAYGLINTPLLNTAIGDTWILSSKIARKAGYEQTAYSAVLQAKEVDAPFAFIQQAKLIRSHGGVYKALTDVDNALKPLLKDQRPDVIDMTGGEGSKGRDFAQDRKLAKEAINRSQNVESPYYHLGHYYDSMSGTSEQMDQSAQAQLIRITQLLNKARKELPPYQFLTAFPQIVSRIVHPNKDVATVLRKIMAIVLSRYPQQALWPAVGAMQSKRTERRTAAHEVTNKASSTDFIYVKAALPTRMILPLQDALTCVLPTTADTVLSHNPFPTTPVEIAGFDDRVDIMPSLQKPKKLVFIGSDGKRYPFLCKPHDDLRKDARLMDLNAMINKLLKSATESRRRQLLMPLNEECGLLEWVANTYALKGILEKGYARYNKKIYVSTMRMRLS